MPDEQPSYPTDGRHVWTRSYELIAASDRATKWWEPCLICGAGYRAHETAATAIRVALEAADA